MRNPEVPAKPGMKRVEVRTSVSFSGNSKWSRYCRALRPGNRVNAVARVLPCTASSDNRQLSCSRFRRTPSLRKLRVKTVVPILVQVQRERDRANHLLLDPPWLIARQPRDSRISFQPNLSTPSRLLRKSSSGHFPHDGVRCPNSATKGSLARAVG
jgi:hypothetical protein